MPQKCYFRPIRTKPRRFDEHKLAKLLCSVVRRGGSRAVFEREYEIVCPDAGRKRESAAAEALAAAEQALVETNSLFDADAAVLQRFLIFSGFVGLAMRYIVAYAGAPGKIISAGFSGLVVAARERVEQIAVQRAANDAALAIVRRAAANEERFRRVVGL